jgi:hypothetical protein
MDARARKLAPRVGLGHFFAAFAPQTRMIYWPVKHDRSRLDHALFNSFGVHFGACDFVGRINSMIACD